MKTFEQWLMSEFADDLPATPTCERMRQAWNAAEQQRQATVKESLTAEQHEDGAVCYTSLDQLRDSDRRAGPHTLWMPMGTYSIPLYPESVGAERDALRSEVDRWKLLASNLTTALEETSENRNALAARVRELVAEACDADLCLQAVSAARKALAEHFGGNLAFLDDDLLLGVVLMKEHIDELVEALEAAWNELVAYADEDEVAEGYGYGTRSEPHESIRPVLKRIDALIAKHKEE